MAMVIRAGAAVERKWLGKSLGVTVWRRKNTLWPLPFATPLYYNQESSRIPKRTDSWCKINANEAGPALGDLDRKLPQLVWLWLLMVMMTSLGF